MIYILCLIFGFFIGWKFAKVWNLLQISVFKKQLDMQDLEDKINKKYKKEINIYQQHIQKLQNQLDYISDIKKNKKFDNFEILDESEVDL